MKKFELKNWKKAIFLSTMVIIAAACEEGGEPAEVGVENSDENNALIFETLYRDEDAGVTGFDLFTKARPENVTTDIDGDEVNKKTTALGTSTRFVVVVWEGAANDGRIFDAFLEAVSEINGSFSYKGSHLNGWSSLSTAKSEIDEAVSRFALPPSQLNLLLVGKSFGGAKTYKLLYDYASSFDDFESTAVVTVDAHEVNPPGNEGMSGYWYDYVYFNDNTSDWNGDYDLAWHSRWNSFGSKLRNWNVYQREAYPKGYSFSSAYVNTRTWMYDHWDIADSHYAINYIGDAIDFLLN